MANEQQSGNQGNQNKPGQQQDVNQQGGQNQPGQQQQSGGQQNPNQPPRSDSALSISGRSFHR